MSLPFGLKAPSKGTLIFSGVAGAISGIIYTSNKNAEESRKRLAQRVSFLADRPCGVHEMPRKVTIYITAPPGDGLEKSRNWFREYVKPILVAGAVDYEIKEAKAPGQIETSVMEEVVKRRRQTEEALKLTAESNESNESNESMKQMDGSSESGSNSNNPFASPSMDNMMNKKDAKEVVSDGILAIGRNAYREVLNGLSKGCDASLAVVEEAPTVEETPTTEETPTVEVANNGTIEGSDVSMPTEVIEQHEEEVPVAPMDEMMEQTESYFSLPDQFSPVMYIPHVNIIGWTNIPYRLYMWYADNKRIEEVGKYVVAAVLNEKRPFEKRDADLGQAEKKYWIGDEEVEALLKNDTPIEIDERIIDKLTTYTSDDLP